MLALLWVRGVGALPPGACVGFLSRSREQRVTPTDGSESTGGVAANAALSFFCLLFVAVGFHIHCWRRDFRIQVIKRGRASRRLVVRISLCFFVLFFQNCQRELPVLSSAVQSRAASRQRRNIGSNSFNMLSRWKLINTCKDIFVVKICAPRSLQW